MRLLHTSDWHLGHLFHGRRREEEFREFLGWLQNVLVEKKIDVLLVAGDIFDTNSPGNSCAGMYYDFLAEVVRATGRLRIIIVGGNHDSPSFLNAPAGGLYAARRSAGTRSDGNVSHHTPVSSRMELSINPFSKPKSPLRE